jgi:transcription elongation factor GreA
MSNFLTKIGLQQLQDRRTQITEELLPAITVDINNARDQGDLKENAGFQTALKVRDELVAELAQIEEILNGDIQMVENNPKTTDIVRLGNTVVIEIVDSKNQQTFKIVGTSESNYLEGKISNVSPLAEAILGKKKSEVCEFRSPNGIQKIKIIEIK